jgi:hypothetical protein
MDGAIEGLAIEGLVFYLKKFKRLRTGEGDDGDDDDDDVALVMRRLH